MIYIDFDKNILDKYHKIIRCWFLRKFAGGKTHKNGYHCGNDKCEICSKSIHKVNNIPEAAVDFFKNNIDTLIIGNPSQLIKLYKEYVKLGIDDSGDIICDFFVKTGYTNWFQDEFAKDFLSDLNINTCIYCNRNYTLDILYSHTRAELDHWFPKDKFPILALSLHNFIPSCHSCNHIKGNGDKTLKRILKNENLSKEEIQQWWENVLESMIHPHDKNENENFTFTYEYDKSLNSLSVKLNINPLSKKVSTTLEFNKILEIYNAHANFELKDLYDLRKKYSDTFLNIIENNFDGIMKKEEAYRIIFGIETNEKDYHKRPFSKFKFDIIEELKKGN
ncbi:hypothetical protein [Chryseobacterium sp.]|uniref:hypothetical protein n=1 Tax=Chryseobacterium sp. TaxID=1871047 RepID=UPI0028972A0B|nr:hypothetical protein [Chryseobacterium sp.]